MSLFFLITLFIYLSYYVLALYPNYDRSETNKQGCGSARKGHGKVVKVTKFFEFLRKFGRYQRCRIFKLARKKVFGQIFVRPFPNCFAPYGLLFMPK